MIFKVLILLTHHHHEKMVSGTKIKLLETILKTIDRERVYYIAKQLNCSYVCTSMYTISIVYYISLARNIYYTSIHSTYSHPHCILPIVL
jgi:hypothetical protein